MIITLVHILCILAVLIQNQCVYIPNFNFVKNSWFEKMKTKINIQPFLEKINNTSFTSDTEKQMLYHLAIIHL
jgi:hypothetical protein